MAIHLLKRLEALEEKFRARCPHPNVREVNFVFQFHGRKLPPDTVIPPGGRMVEDFEAIATQKNWKGQQGLTYLAGTTHERITFDPNDNGTLIERNSSIATEKLSVSDSVRSATEQ